MAEPTFFRDFVSFTRELFSAEADTFIPLHAPVFAGNEKKYLNETIDSTFVSSVGEFVNRVEKDLSLFTGSHYAIATGNGTLALHAALVLADVQPGDEVILQPLTFVATGNAIKYCQAHPVFVDVDKDTAGMSADSLDEFLNKNAKQDGKGNCINTGTGRIIKACVPMHTFGLACRIQEIAAICARWNIALVEDSAESIGTTVNGVHTGKFGQTGVLSFNGNKTITCGGGGAILTDDESIGKLAKHITTTAKRPHAWEFFHDQVGYNYRMPNLNAALLAAQLEELPAFLENKKNTAGLYHGFLNSQNRTFLDALPGTASNYWLNTVLMTDRVERDAFLQYTNDNKVMTRPVWTLLNKMPAFENDQVFESANAQWLEDRIINIPSSVRSFSH
jgi:perosamine synthetase